MAILKIARMGHPVLRRPAEPVEDTRSDEVKRLVADMMETLEDAGGLGLAAPQVHVSQRIVIFQVPESGAAMENGGEAASDDRAVPMTVLLNPVIEPLDEEKNVAFEGCLSIPDMTGAVPRYNKIRYRAVTPDGGAIDRTASGFHARVVQHECDHLDGILYPQRITDMRLFGFVDEIRKKDTASA